MSSDTPDRRRSGRGARIVALAGAGMAAGLAAGVVAQRRHSRTLARDPEYLRLIEPLDGSELPVVSADGTRLHAIVLAPDPATTATATVVLAHGWTEQLSFWGPVIRRLRGRGLRIVAYDLRGHGSSGPAAGDDYSIERFGEDVEAVLAAADAAREVIVAGHSLGGMSIAAWAADHDVPARVAGAVLVNTGLDDLIGGALVLGEIGKRLNPHWLSRALLGSSAPLPPLSTPVERALIRHTAFGPTATDAEIAFYERMLIETPGNVRAATGIAMSDLHLGAALAKLTVPTLVIDGDRDRLTPPEHSRRIAEALPSPAGLVELERTGHMSPLERPDEVAAAIAGLVRTVVAAPADVEAILR